MNTFATKDMSAFFAKREENYARLRRREFTEAEKKAKSEMSSIVTAVWDGRSKEERVRILKPATDAAAKSNLKAKK